MTHEIVRTLFVEDEPDLREIVNAALRLDPGFVVSTFPTAEDALAALTNNEERFDLALLDVRLPVMSGIDLHHRLRRVPGLEAIKTVLMTASLVPKQTKSPVKDLRGEILGVIQKPFHPLKLASELRALLNHAR